MSEGDLLWKLLGIVVVILQVVTMGLALRRKPSIPEEMYRDFATKAELAALRAEWQNTMREYFNRQHANQMAIDDKFQAIMNIVGKLSGQLDRCPYLCKE